MMKATCAGFGHGDILVMDGQCHDEFLHRTDRGREQERINVTFCWIKQHVHCKAGVACCLPTFAQGSSVPVTGSAVFGVFLVFLVSSWCFVHMESASSAGVHLFLCTLDTPFWRRSVGHYFCDLWGECLAGHETAKNTIGLKVVS